MIARKYQKGIASALVLAILALAGTGGVVIASDAATPGDALYSVDQAVERVRLAVANSPEAQAQIHAELAQERIEEAVQLSQQNREQHMVQALNRYQEHLQNAQQNAQEAQNQGKDVDEVLALLSENAARQQEVLSDVYERVPEEAKEAILKAMNVSQRGFTEATNAVSGEKQEELRNGAGQRLQDARNKLEDRGVEFPEFEPPLDVQSNGAGSQGQGNRPSSQ